MNEPKRLDNWKGESYNDGAIYWIKLENQAIDRFFRIDNEGILAIGKTKKLRNRIRQFFISINNGNEHSEANTLFLIKDKFNQKFGNPIIFYSYEEYKEFSKEELYNKEHTIIKEYVEKFGEVPPLNSAIPKKENWITEKKSKKVKL